MTGRNHPDRHSLGYLVLTVLLVLVVAVAMVAAWLAWLVGGRR